MVSSKEAIEMFVSGLVLDPATQSPVVLLKDESGSVTLPIWIGVGEATSIASALKQVEMQRPLTHDLMYSVLAELGAVVERVFITELKDSTYYSELVITCGDRAMIIDSRPSDSIAMAIRAAAPIFVAQDVLEAAKAIPQPVTEGNASSEEDPAPTGPNFQEIGREKWNELLESLDPDDFKYKI